MCIQSKAQEEHRNATELLLNTKENQKVFDETLALKKQTFDKAHADLEKWSFGETIEYDISLTTAKKAWCSVYETQAIVDNDRRKIDGFARDLADAEEKLAETVAAKNAMVFGDKEIEKEAEELSGLFLFYFIFCYSLMPIINLLAYFILIRDILINQYLPI